MWRKGAACIGLGSAVEVANLSIFCEGSVQIVKLIDATFDARWVPFGSVRFGFYLEVA